jgi:hypothetical protein
VCVCVRAGARVGVGVGVVTGFARCVTGGLAVLPQWTGADRTGLDRTRICSGGGCGLVLGRGRRAFRRAPANEHRTGTLSSDFQLEYNISYPIVAMRADPLVLTKIAVVHARHQCQRTLHVTKYRRADHRSVRHHISALVPVVPNLPCQQALNRPDPAVAPSRRPPPSAAAAVFER